MTPARAESVISRANDQAVWPWQAEPYKLWSLLDMLAFSARAFFWNGRALRSIRHDCMIGAAVVVNGEAAFMPGNDLDERAREKALAALPSVQSQFRDIGMPISAETLGELIDDLRKPHRRSFEWLINQIGAVEKLADKELRNQCFLYVPPDHARFFPTTKEPNLFGDRVADAFHDANPDIAAAGRCLAFDEGTASVFYSMRVLEHGLRLMAERFDVPFAVDSWHAVLRGIETGIATLRNKQALTEQDRKEIGHYSEAAAQFRHLKDAWRNHVSHGRKHYDWREAANVMEHVKELMQHLATPIS
jgi:hypothetical protein